jgi:hypothetical protein
MQVRYRRRKLDDTGPRLLYSGFDPTVLEDHMRNRRDTLVLNKQTLRALTLGQVEGPDAPFSGCTQRDNTCTTKREMLCLR